MNRRSALSVPDLPPDGVVPPPRLARIAACMLRTRRAPSSEPSGALHTPLAPVGAVGAALIVVTTIALGIGVAAPRPAAAAHIAAPGVYDLSVVGTSQLMTILDQSTDDNAPVVTAPGLVHLARSWRLLDTGAGDGVYQLRNAASGLCLEMPGAVAPAGTAAQQYRCDPNYMNQPNQLWQLLPKDTGQYVLRNKASGLTLRRTDQGTVIQSNHATTWSFAPTRDVHLVCSGSHYRGACVGSIISDGGNPVALGHLSGTGVGGRTVWSVLVANAGDRSNLALFSSTNFAGTCQEFTQSDPNLADGLGLVVYTVIHDLPKPSSAVLGKRCPSEVELCTEAQFGGICRKASGGGNLKYGDDYVSVYMRPGSKITLYSDHDNEGTCETFTATDANLADNYIGANRASSFWVDHGCRDDVLLCEHASLEGRCVAFRTDKRALRYTDIGNDTASSVHVPAGWQISVHSDENHGGLIDPFNGPVTRDFGGGSTSYGAYYVTSLPNDSASSLDIRATPLLTSPCSLGISCMFQLS